VVMRVDSNGLEFNGAGRSATARFVCASEAAGAQG
jgi:hypothetical protein